MGTPLHYHLTWDPARLLYRWQITGGSGQTTHYLEEHEVRSVIKRLRGAEDRVQLPGIQMTAERATRLRVAEYLGLVVESKRNHETATD